MKYIYTYYYHTFDKCSKVIKEGKIRVKTKHSKEFAFNKLHTKLFNEDKNVYKVDIELLSITDPITDFFNKNIFK